jgi:hypothetical protein
MKAAYQVNDFILDKKTRRMGTIDRVGFGPFSRLKDGDSSYGTVYYVAREMSQSFKLTVSMWLSRSSRGG